MGDIFWISEIFFLNFYGDLFYGSHCGGFFYCNDIMKIIESYYDILNSTYIYYNGYEIGDDKRLVDIMSMTKSFIGIIYGFIFRDRLIKPSTKVYTLLPEWDKEYYREISFHELLCHTAGIIEDNHTTYEMYKSRDIIKYCINRPIKRDERLRYSNSGYMVLGYLIKRITRLSPSRYLKSRIDVKLKWVKLQGLEPGFAHIFMSGKDLVAFVHSVYENKDLRQIIKYCAKNAYGMRALNNHIVFQDGWGGQDLIFNRRHIFLHLRKIPNNRTEKHFYDKYIIFYEKITKLLYKK